MAPLTWVLESDVFPASHRPLRDAIREAGETIIDWHDEWLTNGNRPTFDGTRAVFHGSLGSAAVIAERFPWCPGAWCNTSRFFCSAWYDSARAWLVHRNWIVLPADEFVKNSDSVFAAIGALDRAFVRPDSP